jgi:NAD(P)-dependent dehydrogenase (short-subunit alcohol dehydrogenase family)
VEAMALASFLTRICPGGSQGYVSDVNASEGGQTARLIRDSGGEAVFVKADVSSAADVNALVKKAVASYGSSLGPLRNLLIS